MLGNDFDKISWGYFKYFSEENACKGKDTNIGCQPVWKHNLFYGRYRYLHDGGSWAPYYMGYEVDKDLLVAYVDHLLSQLVDTTAKHFGTYKERSLQVHSKIKQPVIAKKVRKEVKAFAEKAWFTKEANVEAREKNVSQQAETSSVRTGTPTSAKTRARKEKTAKTKNKKKQLLRRRNQ